MNLENIFSKGQCYSKSGELIKDSNKILEIETIFLSARNLKEIPVDIKYFSNLKTLNLNNNEIEKMENLNNLYKLKLLNLSNNKIKNLNNIERLGVLEEFHIENNEIEEVCDLILNKNLKMINLNNNKITNMKFIEKVKNLTTIVLSNNKIELIEGLESIKENIDTKVLFNKNKKTNPPNYYCKINLNANPLRESKYNEEYLNKIELEYEVDYNLKDEKGKKILLNINKMNDMYLLRMKNIEIKEINDAMIKMKKEYNLKNGSTLNNIKEDISFY
jgi:Leucine-rich repeat (LRR) protein